MKIDLIDVRETLPSGGSAKVTVPMKIVKEWGKAEERLSEDRPGVLLTFVKKFPVCFIRSDGKVILELPENVVTSGEYPSELIKKVREVLVKDQMKTLADQYEDLLQKLATGHISNQAFDNEVEKIIGKLKEISRTHVQIFRGRDLHFIDAGELEHLFASMSIEDEEMKEESFHSLIDDIRGIKEDAKNIETVLKRLDEEFKERKVDRNRFETIKERYLGKLTLAEKRLDRLRNFVNDP
jgi:hypothetical protein